MTLEAGFSLANGWAMTGWLMLLAALALDGAWRQRLLRWGGRVWPLVLAGGYSATLLWHWGSAPGGGFGSLQAVATLFASPGLLLAGWVHYLAFDLLVGRWVVDDALARRLPRLALPPVLLAVFMVGPLGLLLYLALRTALGVDRQWLGQVRQRAPLLWWAGWLSLALSLLWLALALSGVDARQINGISVWLKPWKFHLSVGVHLLTLAIGLALLPAAALSRSRLRGITGVALAATVFELAYITWRAAQGLPSHYARESLLAQVAYPLMGVMAVALTSCAGLLGWWLLRAPGFAHGPVLQRGLGLGLLLGWLLGTAAGIYLGGEPGHWVGGTPSDAGGLALLKWSRDGGDLRVAHFFGLHAMQALPLLAWWAGRRLPVAAGLRLVHAAAAGWTLLTVAVFAQAVAGRPFV